MNAPLHLTVLYRGPLASCNYDCWYCPFAKRHDTAQQLRRDREDLARFLRWAGTFVESPADRLSVFFTPWGEALTRPWYRDAFIQLTALPHVHEVAVQTNLSCSLEWLRDCDRRKVGLWCTYHPSQVARKEFLESCAELDCLGVRYSVGMVGLREVFDEIEALRRALPDHVYLWINAFKQQPGYYTASDIRRLEAVDPHFRTNTTHHASFGKPCRTGESVVSVDGAGTIRRCHFVKTPIGNLYEDGWRRCLRPRPCPNATCGCHIGYVHLDDLRQHEVYGDGLLERIPAGWAEPPQRSRPAGEAASHPSNTSTLPPTSHVPKR